MQLVDSTRRWTEADDPEGDIVGDDKSRPFFSRKNSILLELSLATSLYAMLAASLSSLCI